MVKALYVHVPFCKSICAYCDFFRCGYYKPLADKWLNALNREINEKNMNKHLKTIYIGGGTPTALSYDQLETLLKMLKPYTEYVEEYTIEANVEQINEELIDLLLKYNVNRISLGVQSLQSHLIKRINRFHNKQMVEDALKLLHTKGLTNISVDFIYGLPEQTLDMWKEDLKTIVFNPYIKHISLYALTIEEHSEFGRKGIKKCDDELEGEMYDEAISILTENGFHHYEISNYSKEGYESKHNKMYWKYEDFYGLGCGASGKENHVRYDNEKNLNDYICGSDKKEEIILSKNDEMFEMIMMSLRMKEGLNLSDFNSRFKIDFKDYYRDILKILTDKKWITVTDYNCFVSDTGMHYLHDVLIYFMEDEL